MWKLIQIPLTLIVLTVAQHAVASSDIPGSGRPYSFVFGIGGTLPAGSDRANYDASYYFTGGVLTRLAPNAQGAAQLEICRLAFLQPVGVNSDQLQIWSLTLGIRLRPAKPALLSRFFLQPNGGASVVDFPQELNIPFPEFPLLTRGYLNRTEVHLTLSAALGVDVVRSDKATLSVFVKPLWVLTGLEQITVVPVGAEFRF